MMGWERRRKQSPPFASAAEGQFLLEVSKLLSLPVSRLGELTDTDWVFYSHGLNTARERWAKERGL
jgi:hypothetical protein